MYISSAKDELNPLLLSKIVFIQKFWVKLLRKIFQDDFGILYFRKLHQIFLMKKVESNLTMRGFMQTRNIGFFNIKQKVKLL